MLKLPKGLKKRKKKSKKDQDLFTEEELEEYKRQLKVKQVAVSSNFAADKSDVDELNVSSNVETLVSDDTTSISGASFNSSINLTTNVNPVCKDSELLVSNSVKTCEDDEEWEKFKALTSGIDKILHKTQDELDRIKKESFYQRVPSAAEKKRLEEKAAALQEAERLSEEQRKVIEEEAQRDKLAEAVVELSEFEDDSEVDVDDIFVTDYIDAITSGEVQLAVVPESPLLDINNGSDPFDTSYAENVIVGVDKTKGNKKLVSLGAAVEVLSGRVEPEKAVELAKPKRKLRKGIRNLLLNDSVDFTNSTEDLAAPEPIPNLLDEIVDDIPGSDVPIDLSVSLHFNYIKSQLKSSPSEEEKNYDNKNDFNEFDLLETPDNDEFAELATESLNKKDPVNVIPNLSSLQTEVLNDFPSTDWTEFNQDILENKKQQGTTIKSKPSQSIPKRPTTGPHLVQGTIYISDNEDDFGNEDSDLFNTNYAEEVIKKTTALENDDDFDPRLEEHDNELDCIPLKRNNQEYHIAAKDYDPFDTSGVTTVVNIQQENVLNSIEHNISDKNQSNKQFLGDEDFNSSYREYNKNSHSDIRNKAQRNNSNINESGVDIASRKSSLSLNIQSKTVGFLVSNQDLLGALQAGGSKKPLTPYYPPNSASLLEKQIDDPFDTSYVPEVKPTYVELKHLENDLLAKSSSVDSLTDLTFDPRAPPTPVPAEELLAVKENISAKVLTPAQESKDLIVSTDKNFDPFDTSIAANIKPGKVELKLLESELLPQRESDIATAVLDIQSDAQELGLGDKVLTPLLAQKSITIPTDIDPFDTSIAENIGPGKTEIKLLESELISS